MQIRFTSVHELTVLMLVTTLLGERRYAYVCIVLHYNELSRQVDYEVLYISLRVVSTTSLTLAVTAAET